MSFYPGALRDERVREFLPCRRVVWQRNSSQSEVLVGNQLLQPILENTFGSLVRLEPGGALLLDFGCELHGGVRIINGTPPGRIRLRFGESVSEAMGEPDQEHAIHDEVLQLPAMGMLEYGNTGFRFIRIDAADGGSLELRNILAVALFRDLPRRGSFRSSDSELNRIWETAAYTLQLNMQDYLWDGIKRDRLVWCGDLYVEIAAVLAVFGDVKIIADSLDFAIRHTPDPGRLGGIASFSFWWLIALDHYVYATGNEELLFRERDMVEQLCRIIVSQVAENGSEKVGEMRFLDWYSHTDEVAKHAGLQGLLYWALSSALRCGTKLKLDVSAVAEARDRVRRHRPECNGNAAAGAVQTLGELCNRSSEVASMKFEKLDMFSSFFVLKTLPLPEMLAQLRRHWGGMLSLGATTFWEEFDAVRACGAGRIDELPEPGKCEVHAGAGDFCYRGNRRSLCHGWASGPAALLPERLFGIRYPEPGGRTIIVAPEIGGELEFVDAAIPVRDGILELHWEKGKELHVESPRGVRVVHDADAVSGNGGSMR